MAEVDWHRCKFLESTENLKPLVKQRFGREPSSSIAREIAACLQQGRLFYEAASTSPLEIRPLQQFYGMVGFAKALIVASRLSSLATLRPTHGIKDISAGNARIAELKLQIERSGRFQEFNDVVAPLTRLGLVDMVNKSRAIYFPSATSEVLQGIELSLREILSRIPRLESLYRQTFGEEASTDLISLETGSQEADFRIRVDDQELFADRESLRRMVLRWRERFPFLRTWRLHSAQYAWGNSLIYFRNVRNLDIDEFSKAYLREQNGAFQELALAGDINEPFSLKDGFCPVAGGYSGIIYAIAPVRDLYFSEFSMHYLALFLLSSLMRYRPQTWTHAISRSVVAGEPADDRALSLIERFLRLNETEIPEFVVQILNPHEDAFA
ncbi:MAG: YaaC family protein [Terriglobales bacterium]